MRTLKRNDKGSLSYAIIFVFLAIGMVTLFAVANPLLINISSEFFSVGDDLLLDAQEGLEGIGTEGALETAEVIENARAAENAEILNSFFQYFWIIIIAVVAFVIFITARSYSQGQQQGGIV
jgi:hypothetical protein